MAMLSKINKHIFLIDAGGALLSSILLSIICYFESYFGMPRFVFFVLLPLPILFASFGSYCHLFGLQNRNNLIILAILNSSYAVISLIFMLLYFDFLSVLAVFYFVSEKCIVLTLALIEFKIARSWK